VLIFQSAERVVARIMPCSWLRCRHARHDGMIDEDWPMKMLMKAINYDEKRRSRMSSPVIVLTKFGSRLLITSDPEISSQQSQL